MLVTDSAYGSSLHDQCFFSFVNSSDGLLRQATHGNVDILFGDYLAEVNIARLALDRSRDPTKGYEMQFFRQFSDAVDVIVEKRLRVSAKSPCGDSVLIFCSGHHECWRIESFCSR